MCISQGGQSGEACGLAHKLCTKASRNMIIGSQSRQAQLQIAMVTSALVTIQFNSPNSATGSCVEWGIGFARVLTTAAPPTAAIRAGFRILTNLTAIVTLPY